MTRPAIPGLNEFLIWLGYKGYLIREYVFNHGLRTADAPGSGA